MGDSLDIQNMLQTGYFSTSRARSPREPTPQYRSSAYSLPPPPSYDSATSRSYQLVSRRYRFQPPPPSVEDEEVSLKREYGGSKPPDDETPSRGEIEQHPIIMEVHEHNPERRFVILTGPQSASDGGEPDKKPGPKRPREGKRVETSSYESNSSRRYESRPRTGSKPESKPEPKPEPKLESRPEPKLEQKPEPKTEPRLEPKLELKPEPKPELKPEPKIEPKPEPKPEPKSEPRYEPKPEPKPDTRYEYRPEPALKPNSNSGSEGERPRLETRRSRQNLAKLETDFREEQLPEKYRNYPPTSTAPSDNPPPKPPRPNHDTSIQPDVITYSSGGRERAYHAYSQGQSSNRRSPTQRSYPIQPDDRRFDESNARASSTSSTVRRIPTNLDPGASTRASSGDRIGDMRYRAEYAPPKLGRKDATPTPDYPKLEREDVSRQSKYVSRDTESRPVEEHPKGPRELQQRQKKSVVVQDGRESNSNLEKIEAPSGPRLRPRGPIVPVPIPTSIFPDESPPAARNASTFPVYKEDQRPPSQERQKAQLPYPVDDDRILDPFDIRRKEWTGKSAYGEEPTISMPEIPLPIPIGPETALEARSASIPSGVRIPAGTSVPPGTQPWQPPPFDPERDGTRLERPVGSVRRHSENSGATGVPAKFPECRRKKPVAGMVDWLTLPRTDFNICPECYGFVFGNTEFRNFFQPMLRPSDAPIACDFGVSPWYRIAWLLTLKKNKQDLRLFHEVDSAITATQHLPCPRDRTTSRNWFTIWDPYTRRPVYDFIICLQCAKIIEALLPNLSNIFVPVDSRSEPTRGICSMRFKEKRKRFVMYFDAMEITSDVARIEHEEPDIHMLAKELEKMASVSECHEDIPIGHGYWHTMQFLPQFTVCGDCFDEVVRPRLEDGNVIASNFYKKPERLSLATCQLYSPRMREVFQKACRANDPKYLESKALERLEVELDIREKLKKLDRSNHDEEWVEQQVDKLIREWKRWE
ncbi:hypothetical protein BGZ63DRAFT_424139 [Mariannaea sp. PMI_226]|nr:hypothetical protein BGZ63DRAFT_424139 [Mariannaea sp. PMI_226]